MQAAHITQISPSTATMVPATQITSRPTPLSSELLQFVGGGRKAPTPTSTPQAPKGSW